MSNITGKNIAIFAVDCENEKRKKNVKLHYVQTIVIYPYVRMMVGTCQENEEIETDR
jgi:hypothetical protein